MNLARKTRYQRIEIEKSAPKSGCIRGGNCESNGLGILVGRGTGSGFGEYTVEMDRLNWAGFKD